MVEFCLALFLAGRAASGLQFYPVQFGAPAIGVPVTVRVDGRLEQTFAGKLAFRDAFRTWSSVCADVRGPVAPGQAYHVRVWRTSLFGGNVAKAGHIVARCFGLARTPEQCAGLQLAVWEAIEDGGPQPDFGSGRFQAAASPAALAYAQQYYLAIGDEGEGVYLQSGDDGGQSQLSTTN